MHSLMELVSAFKLHSLLLESPLIIYCTGRFSHSGDITVEWLHLYLCFSHGFVTLKKYNAASITNIFYWN